MRRLSRNLMQSPDISTTKLGQKSIDSGHFTLDGKLPFDQLAPLDISANFLVSPLRAGLVAFRDAATTALLQDIPSSHG